MTTVIADIAGLIQTIYSGGLAETLDNQSAVYNLMNKMGRVKTKKRLHLNWPYISDGMDDADAIPDGGTLPEADEEQYGVAQLDFGILIKIVRIGRLLQRGSVSAEFFKTPEFSDALGSQVTAALKKLAKTIHTQLVADDAVLNGITGFAEAVCKTDNTYANINRVGEPNWQPYVNENGGVNRPLTEALLRDVYNTLQDNRQAGTQQIWAGTTAFYAAADLLNTIARNNDPQNVKGGVLSIDWEGLPIHRIPGMDTNRMMFLDFDAGDGINLIKQHDEDFIVLEESTNSYDTRWSVAGHYQLECHDPFKQGCLEDVN